MKEIIASPNRVLHLGYEGEDNVTLIKFPYDDTWLDCGDGEFKIRVLRHGDTEAYNATEVIDDRDNMALTLTVTDIELSVRGRGELQLVYVCSGAIKKSEIYQYNVHRAIDSEVVSPPDGSIIASVEESLEEIKGDVGSLNNLTTTDKSSLVSAINEVNAKESGSSVTVDDELSGTSENPVQNKVIKARLDSIDGTVSGIGGRLSTAETALESKANTADVNTALSTKANTSDVNTALSGKADKSYVDTELSSKANTADVTTALASKANSSDVQTALAGKASTDVATQSANGLMSAQDKTKLDGLGNSGVSDVQVNGTSVVADGVANITRASSSKFGVVKIAPEYGVGITTGGELSAYGALDSMYKSGNSGYRPVMPNKQHQATFYGLAKAAGHDEKNSTLPVGQYTEEAKTAIRTMLGIEEMYQWYKNNSGN